MKKNVIERVIKKAKKSDCQHKVSAVGLDKHGRVVAFSQNKHRFNKTGGSIHAEMWLMSNHRNIKTIIICRVGKAGDLLPIDPCKACSEKAKDLGIKIKSIK